MHKTMKNLPHALLDANYASLGQDPPMWLAGCAWARTSPPSSRKQLLDKHASSPFSAPLRFDPEAEIEFFGNIVTMPKAHLGSTCGKDRRSSLCKMPKALHWSLLLRCHSCGWVIIWSLDQSLCCIFLLGHDWCIYDAIQEGGKLDLSRAVAHFVCGLLGLSHHWWTFQMLTVSW